MRTPQPQSVWLLGIGASFSVVIPDVRSFRSGFHGGQDLRAASPTTVSRGTRESLDCPKSSRTAVGIHRHPLFASLGVRLEHTGEQYSGISPMAGCVGTAWRSRTSVSRATPYRMPRRCLHQTLSRVCACNAAVQTFDAQIHQRRTNARVMLHVKHALVVAS